MIHELSGLEWSDFWPSSRPVIQVTEGETVSLRTVQHILEFNCGRLLHSFKQVLVSVCRSWIVCPDESEISNLREK